jgi:hypothetical protein
VAAWIYSMKGSPVGFVEADYPFSFQGQPVGTIQGTSDFTLGGSYVGELSEGLIVDRGLRVLNVNPAGAPRSVGQRDLPAWRGVRPNSIRRRFSAALFG